MNLDAAKEDVPRRLEGGRVSVLVNGELGTRSSVADVVSAPDGLPVVGISAGGEINRVGRTGESDVGIAISYTRVSSAVDKTHAEQLTLLDWIASGGGLVGQCRQGRQSECVVFIHCEYVSECDYRRRKEVILLIIVVQVKKRLKKSWTKRSRQKSVKPVYEKKDHNRKKEGRIPSKRRSLAAAEASIFNTRLHYTRTLVHC